MKFCVACGDTVSSDERYVQLLLVIVDGRPAAWMRPRLAEQATLVLVAQGAQTIRFRSGLAHHSCLRGADVVTA